MLYGSSVWPKINFKLLIKGFYLSRADPLPTTKRDHQRTTESKPTVGTNESGTFEPGVGVE